MKKVLLHICCGICALHCIERLKRDYYVEGLFFNPNIEPQEEYEKRKQVVFKVSRISDTKIIEGPYNVGSWHQICDIYKDEPEGGQRCSLCYEFRLFKTSDYLEQLGFDYFTTTLTISPHKNSKTIFSIGSRVGGEKFLAVDFKKMDGFKKTMELAKKHNLYHQNYCGCLYSMKKVAGREIKPSA